MKEFLESWGYLGIFLGLVATGVGCPMPEELPVVIGGALAGHPTETGINPFIMLAVCIAGVIVGDAFLYTIGRLWGPRLLQYGWIKRRVFPPDRLAKIEHNFQVYGVKLLLFARLTPGIRAPIFFTAGLTRLSMIRFLIADSIYAIPGVGILFFLGWWFTDSMVDFIEGPFEKFKSLIAIVVIVAVSGYLVYRFLRKPAVTGDPHEMPPLVEQVTHKLEQVTSKVTTKIMHPLGGSAGKCGPIDEGPVPADGQLNKTPPAVPAAEDSKASRPPP